MRSSADSPLGVLLLCPGHSFASPTLSHVTTRTRPLLTWHHMQRWSSQQRFKVNPWVAANKTSQATRDAREEEGRSRQVTLSIVSPNVLSAIENCESIVAIDCCCTALPRQVVERGTLKFPRPSHFSALHFSATFPVEQSEVIQAHFHRQDFETKMLLELA